ncbi:MAG: PadR family transcriptional regulator [Opitutales bacterium]|nr:PadR family transcriptional regulator [Opitutales bacterium]
MSKINLLQGNLEMMILRILSEESQHGWGITQKIHLLSEEALKIEEGSLYLALSRMQRKGWLKSKWGKSENNRKAKFYELTQSGRKQLEKQQSAWEQLCAVIESVMRRQRTSDGQSE